MTVGIYVSCVSVHVLVSVYVHVSVIMCILVWIHVCVAPPIVVGGCRQRGRYSSFLSIRTLTVTHIDSRSPVSNRQ